MYGWGHRRVVLADLIAFAWSALIRDLATRVQMSDVGLEKLLRAHCALGLPQEHWNRVYAGQSVSEPPAALAWKPGQRPYIHVDSRFIDLPEALLPSSARPFAKVPENLEDLHAMELKAVGHEDHGAASSAQQVTGRRREEAAESREDSLVYPRGIALHLIEGNQG